jgi:exodeoxyribonuclease VII small subunit
MTPSATRQPDPPDDSQALSFEAALSRLEGIVERLESGEITLDESLNAFREGSRLVRFCLDRLASAEEAVQQLVAGEEGLTIRPAELKADDG